MLQLARTKRLLAVSTAHCDGVAIPNTIWNSQSVAEIAEAHENALQRLEQLKSSNCSRLALRKAKAMQEVLWLLLSAANLEQQYAN